ncbi:hypothetical protein N9N67_07955 [Bacteriovoracaceae bacterium]|nr:hypothetical protein [Bacteriovoracaceae bacterium]
MMKSFSILTLVFLLASCGKIVDRHEKKDKLTTTKKSALDGSDDGTTTGDGNGSGNGSPGTDNGTGGPGIDDDNGDPSQVPPTDNTGNNNDPNKQGGKLDIENINPFVADGLNNDVHVNRVTCEVFQKKNGEWILIEKLKNCDEFVIKPISDPADEKKPERNTLYWVQDKAQGYRRDPKNPENLIMVLDGSMLKGNQVIRKPRAPLGTDGNDGDVFIDTTKPLHYVKADGNWTKVCELEQSINPCGGTPDNNEGDAGEWRQDPNRSIWRKNQVGTWVLMSELKVVEKANKDEIASLANKDNLTIYIDKELNDGYIFRGTNLVQVFKNRKNNMNVVHVGPGNPNDRVTDLGNRGDVYITEDNGDMYRKQKNGNWQMSCEGGAFGMWCGEVPPQDKNGGKFGKNQDLYKQSNGHIYQKINKKWVKIYPRKFEYSLIQVPFDDVADPIPGNLYINTITLKGYTVENGEEFDLSDGKNRVHEGSFDPNTRKIKKSRDGDFFYHTTNNFYYKNDNGNWRGICVLNYRGYYCGKNDPANTLGEDGEVYLQQDMNKNVWRKIDGEWKKLGIDSPTRVEYIDRPETLKKLEDAENKIKQLNITINNHETKIENLKEELKLAIENTPEDQSELIKKLQDEKEALEGERNKLQEEVNDLNKRPTQDQIDKLNEEKEAKQEEIDRLNAELEKLREEAGEPLVVDNSEIESLQNKIDTLEAEKIIKDQEITRLKEENERLKNSAPVVPDCEDCDALRAQIGEKDKEIQSLTDQLALANASNNDGQVKLLEEQLRQEKEAHQATKENLQAEKEKLTQLQAKYDKDTKELQGRIDVLVKENSEIKAQRDELLLLIENCRINPDTELPYTQQFKCEDQKALLDQINILQNQVNNYSAEMNKCKVKQPQVDEVYETETCDELRAAYIDLVGKLKDALANAKEYTQEDLDKKYQEGLDKGKKDAEEEAEDELEDLERKKIKAEEDKDKAEEQAKLEKEKADKLQKKLDEQPKSDLQKVCRIDSVGVKLAKSAYSIPLPYDLKGVYKGYGNSKRQFEGQGNTSTKVSSRGDGHSYVANSHVLIAFDIRSGIKNCGWDIETIDIKSVDLEIEFNLFDKNPINDASKPTEYLCFYHRDLSQNPCSGSRITDPKFPNRLTSDYYEENSEFYRLLDRSYGTGGLRTEKERIALSMYLPQGERKIKEMGSELVWFIFTDDIKIDGISNLLVTREGQE